MGGGDGGKMVALFPESEEEDKGMSKEDFKILLKQIAQLACCSVLLLIALLVGSLGFGVWYFPDPSRTEEHKELLELYSAINIGMSKDDVMKQLPPTSDRLRVSDWGRSIHVTTPTEFFRDNRTMGIYFDDTETVINVRIRKVDSGKAIGSGDPPDKVDESIPEATLHEIDEGLYQ